MAGVLRRLQGATVIVWQWPDGRALHTLPLPCKPDGDLPSLVLAPDGQYLAASADGNMKVWDLTKGKSVFSGMALDGAAFAHGRQPCRLARIAAHGAHPRSQVGQGIGPLQAAAARAGQRSSRQRDHVARGSAVRDHCTVHPARSEVLHDIVVQDDRVCWAQFT